MLVTVTAANYLYLNATDEQTVSYYEQHTFKICRIETVVQLLKGETENIGDRVFIEYEADRESQFESIIYL